MPAAGRALPASPDQTRKPTQRNQCKGTDAKEQGVMANSFVLRAGERGHDLIRSDGTRASYIAGHPDGFITRESSFNFHDYQSGRPGSDRYACSATKSFT